VNTQLQNLYGLAAKAILPLIPHVFVVSSERIAHNGLHPTRLSPLEIGNLTRFQGVLWRRLFPAAAARVKPGRYVALKT